MINVKLNLDGFGAVDIGADDFIEIKEVLNCLLNFITRLNGEKTVVPDDTNLMFTAAELEELAEQSPKAVDPEIERLFNPAEPVQMPTPPIPVLPTDPENAYQSDLDIDGLPWDVRIHARTRSKTEDGRWKLKRGSDPILNNKIKAELKAVMSMPTPPMPPASLAGAPPIPPAPPITNAQLFSNLMSKITANVAAGRITTELVAAAANALGLSSVVFFSNRTDLIPALEQELTKLAGQPLL